MAMKMFNEWTPQNHGDFLAGFISALRFTDNTQPVIEEITLDPIGVGGKKGLGINVATVEGNNGDTVDINVYTRNVTADTAFGMFSVTLEWDSSRGYIAQLLNGTFGTFGDDVHSSISAGRLNVYGYKEDTSVKFEDNIILFTIRFVITDEVTKGNPIRLSHKNTSNYRMDIEDILENYTSIGQWRENYGGMWGFLSPIDNTDGLIASEKEKEKNNVDDGDNNVNANESPSMIAIGSGSTKQGQTGAVGIWTNANLKDNIQYNKFTCNLLINDPSSYLSLINIIGTDGWNLEYSIGYSGSNMLITLIGTRDTKVTGTVTVGSLVYVVNSDEYNIPLELGSCVLWNDDTQYNVINSDGLLFYSESSGGHDDHNFPPAPASLTGIFVGAAITQRGERGAVTISANSNIYGKFPYNEIHCTVVVEDPNDMFNYLGVVGVGDWSLSATTSTNSDGYLVLDIIGTRSEAKIDNVTVGYIEYEIGDKIHVKPMIPLNNILSQLLNNVEVLDCFTSYINSGYVVFDAYGYVGEPPGPGGGDTGGMGGYGSIWSGTEQIIWVSVGNSPKVPVYLEPGDNDVWFYIPYIFPDEEVDEGSLKIESEDYIWIPAGFRIIKTPAEDAPPAGLFINFVDKIRSNEVFDMLLQHVEPPVDLDDIIDRIYSADVFDAKLRAVQKKFDLDNIIDTLNSVDILEIIKRGVNKKFDLDTEVDSIPSSEVFDVLKRPVDKKKEELTEAVESSDEATFEMKFAQKYTVSGSVDDVSHGSIQGLGTYEEETIVMLKALPASGWQVDKWYINNIEVSSNLIYRVKLNSNIEVYLTFKTT